VVAQFQICGASAVAYLFKPLQLAIGPAAGYAAVRLHDPVDGKLPGMQQPPLLSSRAKHTEYVFPPAAPVQLVARKIAANDCFLPRACLELSADSSLMAGGSCLAADCLGSI
jgi:hypothetical protein